MDIQACTHCVLSSEDDTFIHFDEFGVCNYCLECQLAEKLSDKEKQQRLTAIVHTIQEKGKRKKYDCLIGVSGGVDSTYLVYQVVKLGLHPLIVHYDNGWNSELAIMNIENLVKRLKLDLITHVNNWKEFRDLQRSFIKANVIDIELTTDHAIVALQYKMANKFGIKYIISGSNTSSESILPISWYHWKIDALNIKSIHRKHGKLPLKTFPFLSNFDRHYYHFVKKVKVINLLNYLPYDKNEAKRVITNELGWRDYGGKHFESIFTRFYQAYILPQKFHVDKRKAHLASLICAGQITREQAFEELKKPIYNKELLEDDKAYVIKKLGFSEEEFKTYICTPAVGHLKYASYLKTHYKIEGFFFWLVRPITRFIKKTIKQK